MDYFISDLHFGHRNILSFDNRPFITVEENDIAIINNWNDVVNIDDDVYILGDLGYYNVMKMVEIINSLNGNKHLIIGNHDKKFLKNKCFRECFVEICDYKEIKLENGFGIVLCHYPIPCYNNHFYGWVHLYGHVHNSFEYNMMKRNQMEMTELYGRECKMYNVGAMIDYMGYTPRTLGEIRRYAQQRGK